MLAHGANQPPSNFNDIWDTSVLVSAWTFAGFEVVAFGQVEDATKNSFLDKIASRIVLSDCQLPQNRYSFKVEL
jgi:hypothetical protein